MELKINENGLYLITPSRPRVRVLPNNVVDVDWVDLDTIVISTTNKNKTYEIKRSQLVLYNDSQTIPTIYAILTDLETYLGIKATLSVVISEANDSILVYGNDGTTNRKLKTNASGNMIGAMPDTVEGGSATVTTSGTAVQITATAKPGIINIHSKAANTGRVIVGKSDVLYASLNGRILWPGDSIVLILSDLSKFYLDAETNGNGITYIATYFN